MWFRPDEREHLGDKNLPGQIIEKTSGAVIGYGGGSPVRFCQIWYHTCTRTSYNYDHKPLNIFVTPLFVVEIRCS